MDTWGAMTTSAINRDDMSSFKTVMVSSREYTNNNRTDCV